MEMRRVLWTMLLSVCTVAGSAIAGPTIEVIPDASSEVRWSDGVLQAIGVGIRPKDADTSTQARLLARGAAIADAYRGMARAINEVSITGSTTIEGHVITSDTIRLSVRAYITGAQVVEERDNADGTYQVVLQVNMPGRPGLTAIGLPKLLRVPESTRIATPAAAPADPNASAGAASGEEELLTPASDSGPFTAVVVDTRGLRIQPAMSPRIVDPSYAEVYGTVDADPSYVEEEGIASYVGSIRAALALPRAGSHPLVIRAVGVPDDFRRSVIIGSADAQRLRAENEKAHFLEKCAVIMVIDERRPRDGGK